MAPMQALVSGITGVFGIAAIIILSSTLLSVAVLGIDRQQKI
jgi:hypothetical protein